MRRAQKEKRKFY